MNDQDDIPDEPPPSYQEATGNPSHTHRPSQQQQPPPLPPRQPSIKPPTNATTPATTSPSPSTPHHHPPQTFAQLLPRAAPNTTINRQFPPTINLYRDAFPGALQRRFFLGQHQHPPLYAVGIWPQQQPGAATLVLHNGPSDDFPPLATVAMDARGRRLDVCLPPLQPGDEAEGARAQSVAVTAAPNSFMSSSRFGFRVEVPWSAAGGGGGGAGWRKEAFEWRRTSGGGGSVAVGVLGGAAQGWELVRLADERLPGGGGGPPSGDGHEVVAACTTAVMSLTKLWKFCFLGTGVSGALGERWAVMAVVSGLAIWGRENRG